MKNYSIVFVYVLTVLSVLSVSCTSSGKVGSVKQANIFLAIPDSLYPAASHMVPTHNEWTRGNYPKMITAFKASPLQLHDVVFLGNSITRQGGNWGQRLNRSGLKNRGIAGDVTDGVLQRLGEIIYVQPAAVFLEIGINDLFNDTLSPERTAGNIIKIVSVLHQWSPRTKIFVQTIFPTDKPGMVNRIKETNDRVRNDKNRKLFTLIDTHVLFADDRDLMKKEYTKDGVHLTEKGYQVWVDCLKKYFR